MVDATTQTKFPDFAVGLVARFSIQCHCKRNLKETNLSTKSCDTLRGPLSSGQAIYFTMPKVVMFWFTKVQVKADS